MSFSSTATRVDHGFCLRTVLLGWAGSMKRIKSMLPKARKHAEAERRRILAERLKALPVPTR